MIVLADSEVLDQTAHMRKLIWEFAVRIWTVVFLHGAAHLFKYKAGTILRIID